MSHSGNQLLMFGGDFPDRVKKSVPKKAKKHKLPVLQPQPELLDEPHFGDNHVPKTRADCPTQRPCPHVRCRWNLFRIDAENRAGRPGLSSVPRDERGRTKRVMGDAGRGRPGTTLRPGWMRYRGLEIERECRVYITADGRILDVQGFDYWLEHVRVGEDVLVFDDDSGAVVAKARVAVGGLAMDRALPEQLINSASALVLMRVREVSSCMLDEIARLGKMSNEQTGDAIGRHRTLVAREAKSALRKAVRTAEAMGMEREDFMGALMGMGDGK